MFRSFFIICIASVSFYLIAEKFVNTNGVANEKSFSDFLKWSFSNESPERVAIEISDAWKALDLEKGNYILWIGHASFLINLNGTIILTDPIFSKRASPVGIFGPKRLIPPALNIADLPKIDLVTISHNHYDHLDYNTVKLIGDSTFWFVPLGLKKWFNDRGVKNVIEMDWFESYDYTGLTNLDFVDGDGNFYFSGWGGDWSPGYYQSDDLLPSMGISGSDDLSAFTANANNDYDAKWDQGSWRLGADYIASDDLILNASIATGNIDGGFGDNEARGD